MSHKRQNTTISLNYTHNKLNKLSQNVTKQEVKMSYNEQAERINKELKEFFTSDVQTLTDRQKEFILNLVISVGQVAKFRCRSNTAYDNFISRCFRDLAVCKRVVRNEGDEWESLRAFIENKELLNELVYEPALSTC